MESGVTELRDDGECFCRKEFLKKFWRSVWIGSEVLCSSEDVVEGDLFSVAYKGGFSGLDWSF